jgi:hypothetical protein
MDVNAEPVPWTTAAAGAAAGIDAVDRTSVTTATSFRNERMGPPGNVELRARDCELGSGFV